MKEGESREADGDGPGLHEEQFVDYLTLLTNYGVHWVAGNETARPQATVQFVYELFMILDRLEECRVDVCIHVLGDDLLFDVVR